MKTVGILGSGIVARTLAHGFIQEGYQVIMGTRYPGQLQEWRKDYGDQLKIASFNEAAMEGDLVVLAVKGTAALEVMAMVEERNLSGKTVIDTCNPIADIPPKNGVLKYFTNSDLSLMQQLQISNPYAHLVKAFSCVGNAYMYKPMFGGSKPTMFICGNHAGAKREVTVILHQFGWEVEDLGSDTSSGAIESLCILWCLPGFLNGKWNHAFKLLKQE